MDIRFHLGWKPEVQLLDETAAKLYVENPYDGTFYTRVDVQVEMACTMMEMMGRDVGCYINQLNNYERNLYFVPFTEELTVKSWREDLGMVGNIPHWRSYTVIKVQHGVMLS
jgi:hypothetical protein